MLDMNIIQKIMLHHEVYEKNGYYPPVYRITGSEHKELVDHLRDCYRLDFIQIPIKTFYGVDLEIVAVMETIF